MVNCPRGQNISFYQLIFLVPKTKFFHLIKIFSKFFHQSKVIFQQSKVIFFYSKVMWSNISFKNLSNFVNNIICDNYMLICINWNTKMTYCSILFFIRIYHYWPTHIFYSWSTLHYLLYMGSKISDVDQLTVYADVMAHFVDRLTCRFWH